MKTTTKTTKTVSTKTVKAANKAIVSKMTAKAEKAKACEAKVAKIRVPRKPKSVLTAAQRKELEVIRLRPAAKASEVARRVKAAKASVKVAKAPKAAKVSVAKVKLPTSLSVAKAIMAKLAEDKKFARKVAKSPEPYRAMVYESGLVPNAKEIDGRARYRRIVTALEKLVAKSK